MRHGARASVMMLIGWWRRVCPMARAQDWPCPLAHTHVARRHGAQQHTPAAHGLRAEAYGVADAGRARQAR